MYFTHPYCVTRIVMYTENKGSTTWSKAATDINFDIGYNVLLRDIILTNVLSKDVYSRDVF